MSARPYTAHARQGRDNQDMNFGKYTTNAEFKADFSEQEDHFKCLYYTPRDGHKTVSLWEIMETEFPHVDFRTLLRLNCLERGYIKQGFIGAPVEGV